MSQLPPDKIALKLIITRLSSENEKFGGGVAEWVGRRTLNPEIASSSPALNTKLELFLGRP